MAGKATNKRQQKKKQNSRQKHKRKGGKLGLLFFSFFLLAVLGSYYFLQQQFLPITQLPENSLSLVNNLLSNDASDAVVLENFEINAGESVSSVAERLWQAGIIRNVIAFKLWLRYKEIDRSIGEGLYTLSSTMTMPQVADTLARGGRPRTVTVVFPEGFRAVDFAERLAENFADKEIFLNLFQNPTAELRPQYVPADVSLEGYLFPASYDIPIGSSPEAIVQQLLERFEQELTPEMLTQLEANAMTIHDWITLASIIQSEAGSPEETGIISGVFRNRLEAGWRLESDPTVAYGLNKSLPELDFPAGDFSVDHPWNTYMHEGLPTTPISNPGTDALKAVFAPERTNADGQKYFFFLHGRDGSFHPNLTLEEHEKDVATYLR